MVLYVFFFFSSRRRHTRSYGDWSSDVCSSDLHAVLAFDEGCQSEGLQLLAWHIEASNARSGGGSREMSQEDSRENSSLSKCHCSGMSGQLWTLSLAKWPGEPVRGSELFYLEKSRIDRFRLC